MSFNVTIAFVLTRVWTRDVRDDDLKGLCDRNCPRRDYRQSEVQEAEAAGEAQGPEGQRADAGRVPGGDEPREGGARGPGGQAPGGPPDRGHRAPARGGAHPRGHRHGQDAVRRGLGRVQGGAEEQDYGPGREVLHDDHLLFILQTGEHWT